MRPPPLPERRKEERYLAPGMVVYCSGEPCAAIDVSRSAVRFVRPQGFLLDQETYELVLELPITTGLASYPVEGRIIRFTQLSVVMGYDPPTADWEQQIKAIDTAELTTLEDC
jgi:hypothetical protein